MIPSGQRFSVNVMNGIQISKHGVGVKNIYLMMLLLGCLGPANICSEAFIAIKSSRWPVRHVPEAGRTRGQRAELFSATLLLQHTQDHTDYNNIR